MKKISLALIMLIIVGICIPAVSATILYDEEIVIGGFSGGSSYVTTGGVHDTLWYDCNKLYFPQIESVGEVSYIGIDYEAAITTWAPGTHEIIYNIKGVDRPATLHVSYGRNALMQHVSTRHIIYFDNWDSSGLTGGVSVSIPTLASASNAGRPETRSIDGDSPVLLGGSSQNENIFTGKYHIVCASTLIFKNNLKIIDDDGLLTVNLYRNVDGISYSSGLSIFDNENRTVFSDMSGNDIHYDHITRAIDRVIISPPSGFGTDKIYPITVGDGQATSGSVTIYICNSQTNALIANAQINISASVNGTLHEVANETVPSGIYSIDLQPTAGGPFDPDFYRLIATAEGYNSIMPYIDFDFRQAVTIYAVLEPVGGAPLDENNTFIDFYVRDLSANPISGATVNFGGYTLITNSAGYTIFEVEKDKTYSWVVSKSGYGSLTGNVNIGNDDRYTINTVIAPAVTPTTPTSIPTSTPISPTPTMTAPTGESVSNLLEWFAAHFGMVLGGGVEIGKIFMWLCFTVPVGVYVGKEAKAGAAGFMAGAGIVTLFFVLIGWVPIWIVVLLALIIGLLYAKVFNNTDNGGGR